MGTDITTTDAWSTDADDSTTTTTGTTLRPATNIWQWRSDMDMKTQQTYDLSGDVQEQGLYGGCWNDYSPDTLAGAANIQYGPPDQQLVEDGRTYGTYDGETGLTLLNLRKNPEVPGCLMRKSRVPIDLSVVTRIELDVFTEGPGL